MRSIFLKLLAVASLSVSVGSYAGIIQVDENAFTSNASESFERFDVADRNQDDPLLQTYLRYQNQRILGDNATINADMGGLIVTDSWYVQDMFFTQTLVQPSDGNQLAGLGGSNVQIATAEITFDQSISAFGGHFIDARDGNFFNEFTTISFFDEANSLLASFTQSFYTDPIEVAPSEFRALMTFAGFRTDDGQANIKRVTISGHQTGFDNLRIQTANSGQVQPVSEPSMAILFLVAAIASFAARVKRRK